MYRANIPNLIQHNLEYNYQQIDSTRDIPKKSTQILICEDDLQPEIHKVLDSETS